MWKRKIRLFFATLSVFILFGCTNPTITQNVAQDLKESISDIYNSLPEACKSDLVENRFKMLDQKVENITLACQAEIEPLETRVFYLRWIVFLLTVISIGLLGLLLRKCF